MSLEPQIGKMVAENTDDFGNEIGKFGDIVGEKMNSVGHKREPLKRYSPRERRPL